MRPCLLAIGLLFVQLVFADSAADLARGTPQAFTAVDLLRWSGGFLAVLAIIFVLAMSLRRLNGIPGLDSQHFRIMAGVSLGTREKAVLLQVGNKQLLIGVAPGRVQTLCVLEGDDVIVASRSAIRERTAFADRLHELLRRKRP